MEIRWELIAPSKVVVGAASADPGVSNRCHGNIDNPILTFSGIELH